MKNESSELPDVGDVFVFDNEEWIVAYVDFNTFEILLKRKQ